MKLNSDKISICIPTWEQYGRGIEFLKYNFEKLSTQTYKNFNVVISDHSKNDNIKNLCVLYSQNFEIFYTKNEHLYGNSSANTNNAIINADGDIIKIMFQDDFFYQNDALEQIIDNFQNEQCKWLVSGSNHTNDDGVTYTKFMIPYWNKNIPIGVNTISSPSVLSFRNNKPCLFDDKLTMLMDCEMYCQLYIRYGPPNIIEEPLITNRIHTTQISSLYTGDIKLEIDYMKIKYKDMITND